MNILVVSDLDLHRGPFVRECANKVLRDLGGGWVTFDSAGISVVSPMNVPPEMAGIAKMHEVDLGRHKSKPLNAKLLEWCDVAACMTMRIAQDVRRSYPPELGGKAVVFARAADMSEDYQDFEPFHEAVAGAHSLASRLRAAAGKMVRRAEYENLTPEKLGVGLPLDDGPKGPPPGLTEKGLRIWELLNDSDLPLRNNDIAFRLQRLKLLPADIAKTFQGELRRHARMVPGQGWQLLSKANNAAAEANAPTGSTPFDRGRSSSASAGTGGEHGAVRQFTARFIQEFLHRSFGPVRTEEILDGLRAAGYSVTSDMLLEILRTDLRTRVVFHNDGRWSENAPEPKRARHSAPDPDIAPDTVPPARPAPEAVRITSIAVAAEILGVPADADFEEIKKAFRGLIARYHPDKFADDPEFRYMAEEKTRRINQAWEYAKEHFDE